MTTPVTTNDTPDVQIGVNDLDPEKPISRSESGADTTATELPGSRRLKKKEEEVEEEEGGGGGRERIKRHRKEVAGRVWIPEIWGQEELLKDWTDCSGFEASFVNTTVMSARAALIEEGRRRAANSPVGLRMERSC